VDYFSQADCLEEICQLAIALDTHGIQKHEIYHRILRENIHRIVNAQVFEDWRTVGTNTFIEDENRY
jgi:hypothetical protein